MQPRKRPNSDRSLEALEARLRALPPPPVPSGLEARLLVAIPPEMPRWALTSRSRRPAIWAGAAVGLTAACVLVVLLWPEPDIKTTAPRLVVIPKKNESADPVTRERPGDSLGITPWLEARRGRDGAERPTFTWPIQEKSPLMVSIAIPADLLD
jgi:hypothetical protein